MEPEVLLQELKSAAKNSRRIKNLDILHAVCQEQFERGSKDFTVATIGRLSEEKHGPATQSIRNKSGECYSALIACWARHTGGTVKRLPKPADTPLAAILEKIDDPAVRAVMGAVLAQNKKLLGEVNLLKNNANVVIDQRRIISSEHMSDEMSAVPSLNVFTESEISALRHAISKELLEQEGWSVDQHGRLLNNKGRAIFKPGFATAILKVIGN